MGSGQIVTDKNKKSLNCHPERNEVKSKDLAN